MSCSSMFFFFWGGGGGEGGHSSQWVMILPTPYGTWSFIAVIKMDTIMSQSNRAHNFIQNVNILPHFHLKSSSDLLIQVFWYFTCTSHFYHAYNAECPANRILLHPPVTFSTLQQKDSHQGLTIRCWVTGNCMFLIITFANGQWNFCQ